MPRAEPHAVLLADPWQPPPSAHVLLVDAGARTWRGHVDAWTARDLLAGRRAGGARV